MQCPRQMTNAAAPRAHRALAAYVVMAAIALVGCSASGPPPGSTETQVTPLTSDVRPERVKDAIPTIAATAPPALDDAGPIEVATPSRPPASSAREALSTATAFMRAFARTDLTQQVWWDGVAGYFTPAAAPIWASTDVANVPVHHVFEGSASLQDQTTAYRARVAVDTDAGTYVVTLVRAGGVWLVDRTTPPS